MNKKPRNLIAGYNVYLNDDNQKILLDPISKIGYLVKDDDYQKFNFFHNRWPLAIAIGALVYSFTNIIILAVVIALAFGLVIEYRYRKYWLASLTQFPHFKPKNKVTFMRGLAQQKRKWDCLLLGLAYICFGILLVIHGIIQNAATFIIAGEILIMILALYRGIQYLISFFIQIKNKS